VRLIAAGLIALALAERPDWFLAYYVVLAITTGSTANSRFC
jgi:hypothetical protein